jgi:hypothetical protein
VRRALRDRAAHQREGEGRVEARRRREGQREAARPRPHRGQVREVRDQRAAADRGGGFRAEAEVHSLDARVRGEDDLLAAPRAQQCGVVADAERDAAPPGAPRHALDARDQAELAELAQLHQAPSVAAPLRPRVAGES